MKKIYSVIIMIVLIFFMFEILSKSNIIFESVNFSFNIWKNNIFPSLFPFFILSEFLINYGFIELISEIFKPLMNKFFKIKGVGAVVFILSMISGFPSSSKYIRELYKNDFINSKEAEKLLMFTHFSNPLFILGTISYTFLNNKEIGPLILFCHYIGNIIIGFFIRNYYISKPDKNKISLKKALINMHDKRMKSKPFGIFLSNSIMNGINTLLLIFGIITTFLIITSILDNITPLSNYYQSILNGIFEMTQGLKYVSLIDVPLKIKGTLSILFISFGGISVHIQIISILSDTKIRYFPFFVARIVHALISSILFYYLFDLWYTLIIH